ncbi:MAG TPA: AMP-binding protein [Pirellulales bacterium]|jgi:phenylacetate-CoA ligase|nr:AMP-binding protein [Pirellulales bacterium]
MNFSTALERRQLEALDAQALVRHQLRRLNELLDAILPANAFYATKLVDVPRPIRSLDALSACPFTFKEELLGIPHGHDLANNRTWPLDRYARFHQTSGTHGRPLAVLDTPDDWRWWIECWQYVLDAAGVTTDDRVLMAFSFGPFIGFWSAYDALAQRGCLLVPTGGVNTLGRLELARTSRATVVCCTPSYALHLAEVGAEHKLDVGSLGVRRLILAGEPGGSVPAVRDRIESLWQAKVLDHCGATEVGPWGFGDLEGNWVRVIESEFIAEFLSIATGTSAAEGELAELVITTLGRAGSPVIRYRTGDLVRPTWRSEGPNRFVRLDGGVLGRTDDMLIVRGVNVFPASIEQIVRSFPEIVEFRATVYKESQLDQLAVEIEDRLEQPDRVARELQLRLGLSVTVRTVPLGSLPRFEGKGKRFVDSRKSGE